MLNGLTPMTQAPK